MKKFVLMGFSHKSIRPFNIVSNSRKLLCASFQVRLLQRLEERDREHLVRVRDHLRVRHEPDPLEAVRRQVQRDRDAAPDGRLLLQDLLDHVGSCFQGELKRDPTSAFLILFGKKFIAVPSWH